MIVKKEKKGRLKDEVVEEKEEGHETENKNWRQLQRSRRKH